MKLFAFTAVITALILLLKKHQPELSHSLTILAIVYVLFLGLKIIASAVALIKNVAEQSGILSETLMPLLKVLSITILSKLSVDICKESGCLALSTGIELIGNALAITASAPLILSMLRFLASI